MQVLDIQFRNVPDSRAAREIITEKAAALERFCHHIQSCRVIIEQPHVHTKQYHVRIDLTVPPGNELVVHREPVYDKRPLPLTKVVREAFRVARKQLQDLVRRQRWDVKRHDEDQVQAVVAKLFREAGYGFLETTDGRAVYFHRNSVLAGRFDDLVLGTGVRFTEEDGEEGPQASTVAIVEKLGPAVTDPGLIPMAAIHR